MRGVTRPWLWGTRQRMRRSKKPEFFFFFYQSTANTACAQTATTRTSYRHMCTDTADMRQPLPRSLHCSHRALSKRFAQRNRKTSRAEETATARTDTGRRNLSLWQLVQCGAVPLHRSPWHCIYRRRPPLRTANSRRCAWQRVQSRHLRWKMSVTV